MHQTKEQLSSATSSLILSHLYEAAGVSRQGFYQWACRAVNAPERTPSDIALQIANDVRQKYLPGAGAREVYFFIRQKQKLYDSMLIGWGKHRFEALCLANGLRIAYRRFVPKTTIRGSFIFPNIIEGIEICDINQIWVSDISYLFSCSGKLIGYATSLIDLYSRRLLGLNFSQSMAAEETSKAVIQQAFKWRKNTTFDNLIFHSDGGRQYIETSFLSTLRKQKIRSSMADNCFDNAFAEAFNDTLKNHLLNQFSLNSFSQLKKQEQFVLKCYNENKPHNSINRLTPLEFEQNILSLKPCQRTTLKIKKIE